MSYGRRDVRGYVRAKLPEIEIPEVEVELSTEELEKAWAYEDYVQATKAYEHQYFRVLGLDLCNGGHLVRATYRVAHSGRHQDQTWRVIARQLRREYKLPAVELDKLRYLGLEVAKAYKAIVPYFVGGFWRG